MIEMTSSKQDGDMLSAALQYQLTDDQILDGEGKPKLIKTLEVTFTGYGMFKIVEKEPDQGNRSPKIHTGRSDDRIKAINTALEPLRLGPKLPEIQEGILAFLAQYLGPVTTGGSGTN